MTPTDRKYRTDHWRIEFIEKCVENISIRHDPTVPTKKEVVIRFTPSCQYAGYSVREAIDVAIRSHEELTKKNWRDWNYEAE